MLKIVWNFWLAVLPYLVELAVTVGTPYFDLPIDVPIMFAYTVWATQLLVGTTQGVLTYIYLLCFGSDAGQLLTSGTMLFLVSLGVFRLCRFAFLALRAQTRFQVRRWRNGRELWRDRKNLSVKTT